MILPDYIDNTQYTLESVLTQLIQAEKQTNLDIATGFFRIEAWIKLEESMNQLTKLRLLIGRDPTIIPTEPDRIDLIQYFRKSIQQQIETEPFKIEYKQQIDRLIAYLLQPHIEVRLFGAKSNNTQFLHAKAYIFDHYSLVGSSNFTPSGITGNTELNILNKSIAVSRDLRVNWFERFWNHPSVDLNYKTKLIEALNASKFGSKPYTPYQVFVKALYELFKEDTFIENNGTSLSLATFQQEGYERAVKLLERHRGCIIADAVGLGKTYIGLRLIEHYLIRDRQPGKVPRALIICPAQLRDLIWKKKLDEFGLKADIISQEELARKEFNIKQYSQYNLILIDESHNFRNSATNRYRSLQKIITSGKKNKRVILLSATPINNSIYDLYHQILLITRNNENYYQEWGIGNLKNYFKTINSGKGEITELLIQTMVRRSRQDVIKRQQAGEIITIAGREIKFPKRELEKFTYNLEENCQGFYTKLATQIEQLNLAPYNIALFQKKPDQQTSTLIKRSTALVTLMKCLYLKRLESSIIALKNSIENQKNYQLKFAEYLAQGKLLDSHNFRKILAYELQEDPTSIEELIQNLNEIDPKSYHIDLIQKNIETDTQTLTQILNRLQTIEQTVNQPSNYDHKLESFKQLMLNLKDQKVLVFSYFQDTAKYLYNQLLSDQNWINEMGLTPQLINIITGETEPKQRQERVTRFAPNSNSQIETNQSQLNPIQLLICTDVLSEGQNLQDAGVLINYDLHWNPVRMIQRAGRIDRIGTNYPILKIYNCFPEQGLEELLGLVKKLQEKIATIDREVGLDGSVLGEMISDRSLEELQKLKSADTEQEKTAILEELEQVAELVSIDEMRFPLIQFMQGKTQEAIEEIPLGIHSTRTDQKLRGIFLAFKVKDRHFWHFYPIIEGIIITTDPNRLISDKRKIFEYISCRESDYPPPDQLPPVKFDNQIFRILDSAVSNLLEELKKRRINNKIKPKLSQLISKIHHTLQQNPNPTDQTDRIIKIITSINLKIYEKDLKKIWSKYIDSDDLDLLTEQLDQFLTDQQLEQEIETDLEDSIIDQVHREDIKLICYEWFKPE